MIFHKIPFQAYSKQKVGLSGYGVELHLKSTEYKSQDDSPQQSDDAAKTGNDDDEPEVEGFDFKVLKYGAHFPRKM